MTNQAVEQDLKLLEELRRRRAELVDSMYAVEHALASPVGVGRDWAERVHAALAELVGDLRDHVAITEGPAGLYRELETHAPRLAGPVAALAREHAEIGDRVDGLLASLDAAAGTSPDVDEVRRAGTDLLGVLMRHRQRGADLVFEAYDFDLGGET